MEKSLKILKIFGFVELGIAIIGAAMAIMGKDWSAWLNVVAELLTAYLLLSAAKDPHKYIGGAWAVTLLAFILSLLDLRFTRGQTLGTVSLIVYPIVAILNLIVFLAANKVRNVVKKDQE